MRVPMKKSPVGQIRKATGDSVMLFCVLPFPSPPRPPPYFHPWQVRKGSKKPGGQKMELFEVLLLLYYVWSGCSLLIPNQHFNRRPGRKSGARRRDEREVGSVGDLGA